MAYTPFIFLGGGGRGRVKIFEKYLLGGVKKFYFVRGQGSCIVGGEGNFVEGGGGGGRGGHGILKENLKLHNLSIKSIFRITNLIYFGSIRNTH